MRRYVFLAIALGGTMLFSAPVQAVLIKNMTTGQVLFQDNFDNVAGSPVGFPDEYATLDDYDPSAQVGSWLIDEDRNDDPPSDMFETIQVSGFSGTTTNDSLFYDEPTDNGPLSYPSAFDGPNYLRINRYKTNDAAPPHPVSGDLTSTTFVSAEAVFPAQTTPGDHIHIEFMSYVRSDPTGNNLGILTMYASDIPTNSRIAGIHLDVNGDIEATYGGSTPGNSDDDLNFATWEMDKWQRWDVDYIIGSQSISVAIDGGTPTVLDIYDLDAAALNSLTTIRFASNNDYELMLDATVPEPSTVAMLALAGLGAVGVVWRRRQA